MHRKTEAHINLDAIRANFALASSLAPNSKSMAVIKANAYGHGMLRVAEALQDIAPAFAVATVDEALELREAGIRNPILVLQGASTPGACKVAAASSLTLAVHTPEQVASLLTVKVRTPVWLKIDSGMHGLGLVPGETEAAYKRLAAGGIDVQVVCTHFARADEPDNDATARQIVGFDAVTANLGLPRSLANSAAILTRPDSHADWNRPGYMLYGNSPLSIDIASARELQPAMTLRSEIIAIRDVPEGESVGYGARWTARRPSVLGTVAIGYADGYPRHAPSGTPTRVNGRIAPLVGTVSMDAITIDLTEHEHAAVGDSVELWGRGVALNDIAAAAGTIGYQLLTGVSARVPRIYA
ncbi:MAG TPA: alanine racemase [Woeseiaceae bacterium]|nr:alanine racemase [Woeseiaceae bacterium]